MSKFLFLGAGVFTLFCLSGNALSQSIWDGGGLPKSIVEIKGGKKRYAVYFDPFLVRAESEKIVAKKYEGIRLDREKWEEVFSKELEKYDFSPGRRVVAGRVLSGIGKSLLNKDVYFNTTVSAMILDLNNRDLEIISGMKEVTLINEIKESVAELSFPYSNYYSGGELVSWAKIAVNADDGMTTINPFYFMDMSPGDLRSTNEYSINHFYSEPTDSVSYKYHPAAIAQIVSGRRNGLLGRGINPGQPLYLASGTYRDISSYEKVINHADSRKISAVLNVSSNPVSDTYLYIINPHQEIGKMMLRASNRFLITQSASNKSYPDNLMDACPFVYNVNGAVVDNDAIFSIGAINYEGKVMSGSINRIPDDGIWTDYLSSRAGSCVDFYAPGGDIYAYKKQDGQLDLASGTSYAAPIVAAIASRYGDSKTKPLEREDYIKSILVPTGHLDPLDGKAIKIPRYQNKYFGVLKNHPIGYAISPVNAEKIKYVKDDNYFQRPSEFWHASGNAGSFTIDLGGVKNVKGIRIVLETSSPGLNPVHFSIYGSSSAMNGNVFTYDWNKPTALIKNHTAPFQYERAPIYIPLDGNYWSIRVDGNNPTSWFAVVEVEVYGY